MSITVNCSIDLTEEELLFILRRRADHAIIDQTLDAATAAVSGNETLDSSGPAPPVDGDYPMTEGIPPPRATPERIEAVETVIAAALPPKPTRRAKANGAEAPVNATPLAPPPPPEALDEPAMRSLLSKVGAVHPLKVKAITDLLEAHGGKRRLSECDPATWPAIAEEAQKVLAEYEA
jgi:hypothetical protein